MIVNLAIGGAGLILSLLGVLWIAFSRFMEIHIRRHLSGLFFVMALYYLANIVSFYASIEGKIALSQWGTFLFSLFSSMMMLILTSLIHYSAGESLRNNGLFISVFLLWTVYVGMLISTIFSSAFYSFSEKGEYERGPLYPLLLFPPVLIMLLNLCGMWRRRKKLNRNQIWAYQMFILVPLFSMLVQMFYSGILATALGIMFGAVALFYFVQKDQEDKFIQMTEENADRRFAIRILQIRPHFIYNVMSSIYYIIDENPAKAREVVRDFSIYLRKVFRSISSQEQVPFTEELEHTRAYLSVEMARFTNQLNVIYDTPYINFKLPPLTLQPVVENAVKHGMDPEIDRLNITIRTRNPEGFNEIIVENDGQNFEPPLNIEDGIGLPNISDRLKRMCKGELFVTEREGGGTVVTIRIPETDGQSVPE